MVSVLEDLSRSDKPGEVIWRWKLLPVAFMSRWDARHVVNQSLMEA